MPHNGLVYYDIVFSHANLQVEIFQRSHIYINPHWKETLLRWQQTNNYGILFLQLVRFNVILFLAKCLPACCYIYIDILICLHLQIKDLLLWRLFNCSLLWSVDDVLSFFLMFALEWIVLWMLALLYILLVVHASMEKTNFCKRLDRWRPNTGIISLILGKEAGLACEGPTFYKLELLDGETSWKNMALYY